MTATTTFAPGVHTGPVESLVPHVALSFYPYTESVSRWDVALWDAASSTWEGPPPAHDVTCDVISVQTNEGRDLPLERFRPGSCTVVVDDPDGLYSPWFGASDPDSFTAIRVGIEIAVWVEDVDTSELFPRFRGIVETIEDDFPDAGARHTVTFHAFDHSSLLAAFDGLPSAPVGAGELTGQRLGRIVDNAGYRGDVNFDAGTVTLQATTLDKNALDEAGLTVDTEFGALWADRDGVLQFRDRNGLLGDPHYVTPQAIFGDVDDGPDDEICYTELALAVDTDKLKNIVTIAPAGGADVTLVDPTSIALFHPRTYRRSDLLHDTPGESTIIAQRHLDFYAYAANRIEALTVDLATLSPEQRRAVLALDTLWLVEVRRRATGFQVIAELQIQGMAESITTGGWTVTFKTFSADAIFQAARWDVDVWDTGLWGF